MHLERNQRRRCHLRACSTSSGTGEIVSLHTLSIHAIDARGEIDNVRDIGANTSRAGYLTYPVAGHDMQVKGSANRAVLRFRVPVLETIDASSSRHRTVGLRNVGSNTRLIVMKLIITVAIKHTIYLEDVGVRVCTAELVASAVEAQHELLANMSSALYEGSGLHSVVLRARDGARMRASRLLFLVLLRHSQGWQERRERK